MFWIMIIDMLYRPFSPIFFFFLLMGTLDRLQAQPSVQYTILYTGRTLGYARSPDSQRLGNTMVPSPNSAARAYARAFRAAAQAQRGTVVRIGMGDNFAPNFNARTFELSSGPRVLKDRYFYDGTKWLSSMLPSTPVQSA